jgi:hypothetical protein
VENKIQSNGGSGNDSEMETGSTPMSGQLYDLNTSTIMSKDVVENVRNITNIGEKKYYMILQERSLHSSTPLTAPIKQTNLSLLNSKVLKYSLGLSLDPCAAIVSIPSRRPRLKQKCRGMKKTQLPSSHGFILPPCVGEKYLLFCFRMKSACTRQPLPKVARCSTAPKLSLLESSRPTVSASSASHSLLVSLLMEHLWSTFFQHVQH